MRHLILPTLISSLFLSTTTYAKNLEKGTIQVGSDLDIDLSQGSTETKTLNGTSKADEDSFGITADAQYYVISNLGIGLGTFYSMEKSKEGSDSEKVILQLLGPQITYNFSLSEKVSLYVGGVLAMASADYSDVTSGVKSTTNTDGSAVVIVSGLHYFLSDSVALDSLLTHTSTSLKEDKLGMEIDGKDTSLSIGFSIFL